MSDADDLVIINRALAAIPKRSRDDFLGEAFVKLRAMQATGQGYANFDQTLADHVQNQYRATRRGSDKQYVERISQVQPDGTMRLVPREVKFSPSKWESRESSQSDPSANLERDELLSRLAPDLRAVAKMLESGMTQKEIATRIGRPASFVSEQIMRMRRLLSE